MVHTSLGIVGVSIRLGTHMVDAVITGPVEDGALVGQAVQTEEQDPATGQRRGQGGYQRMGGTIWVGYRVGTPSLGQRDRPSFPLRVSSVT